MRRPRPDQPYLDTCVWEQAQIPLPLIAGQNLAGARIVVPPSGRAQGARRRPGSSCPPNARAAASSTQLELAVSGPNRMAHRLDFTAQDSAGRDYSAAVPVGAALSFSASSSLGRLIDQAGQPLAAPVNASAATGSGPAPLKLTLRKN